MATKTQQAKVITVEELRGMRHPLPESLLKAAGLIRHKRKAMERHLEKVRHEWDRQPRT